MSGSADPSKERTLSVTSLALERMVRSPAALVENMPIGVYTCDREGRIVQYNRRAEELWGRPPDGHLYCGAFRKRESDGRETPPEELPTAIVLATGKAVRDREMILEREDGTCIAILVNVDPIFDDGGALVGAVDCFQDIGELTRMRRQMREGRRVSRDVMEALPVALYTTDAEGKLLYFNKAAEELWGYRPQLGTQRWCGARSIHWPDGTPLPHDRSPMAVALYEKRAMVGPEAVAERPDGTRVPFMPYPTPIFDGDGTVIGGVNMLIDLSEQKRAMAQQRGLLDELNHRVKNTLATIQSLATQTMRGTAGPEAQAFEARLLTLSRVHDQLSRHSWEWADFGIIAAETFAPLRGSAGNRIRLDGPEVHLKPKSALAVAMVLHELAANAERHGALSTPAGSLALHWNVENGRLTIDWREEGGPAVCPPRKRGFGTKLLERSIVEELKGAAKTDYDAGGLHCTMEIPLPGL
jgi:PAS domain S-box-containing protein